MNLTDIQSASGASENDLIHVVKTDDTSQNPAGSSFKIEIGEYKNIFASPDTYITGGTFSNGTATFTNTSGGTFDVTGFTTDNQNNFVRNLFISVNDLPTNYTDQDVCDYINNIGLVISETDSKWNIFIMFTPS